MINAWYLYLFFSAALILAGLLCLLTKRNLIRLFIGIMVIGKGLSLLLVSTGFARANILLAQALVVTFIVVEVSLVAAALALIINIYRTTGSLDVRKLTRLKG
ncbi:MAG: NADH-quinone oxidoreductase subunit K [Candidatus Aminicenantes bacterium]|jgi:multisubunit Na+/H+ antiporter MnhC subunit|nr:NADH-quinone oxidoreductase subunit K [Candidatus Aminicenantes bacterium]